MIIRHRLLAIGVAVVWGLNFLAIHLSLEHFPPLFLVALRFGVIAIPTVLFVPRPQVPWGWVLGYGIGFGTLQFLFLYWGMAAGMPTGLASLVLQSSAPFTVLLGALVFRDRVTGRQIVGLLIATGGLAVVGWARAEGAVGAARADAATVVPFLLVLAGGFGWAIGNLANARAQAPNPLHLTLWMSVVPPLPMLGLALIVEGRHAIGRSLATLDSPTGLAALLGLAYTVLIGTVLGSGVWSWLMTRYPAGVVAPFSMLVPVVGMSSAWVLLQERLQPAELVGAAIVVTGVLLASRARRAVPARDLNSDVEGDLPHRSPEQQAARL